MQPGLPASCSARAAKSRRAPMASAIFDPQRMLSALTERKVRFVLVGGMAAVLHGDVGVTVDIDIVPERSAENLDRLAGALRELGARMRTEGEPDGLPFDCSMEFFGNLSPDAVVNMTTRAGDLDVVLQPSGTRGFSDLRRAARRDRGSRSIAHSSCLARRRDPLQGSGGTREGSAGPAPVAPPAGPGAAGRLSLESLRHRDLDGGVKFAEALRG